MPASATDQAPLHSPVHLLCDSLQTPLGIDDATPRLSWQLDDSRTGARQTAYEIQVSSRPELLSAGEADVWNSGRVDSSQSVAVEYSGPALQPEHRYFWRVQAWDQDGHPYPVSATSWWETGLMHDPWQAKWIGFELEEHRRVRESGAEWISNPGSDAYQQPGDTRHDFRFTFELDQPVKAAHLYVTGKDTAAAWVNGRQVLSAAPIPPWKQSPWMKYTEDDVTSQIRPGKNVVAVEIALFDFGGSANRSRTPMSACLYILNKDGSEQVIVSNTRWRAQLNADGDWFAPEFDDSSWAAAIPAGLENAHPWPTGPVKMLRRTFSVDKPIRSARLYATSLGSYRFWINDRPVGDQILAPGWTDFRTRVPYQVYDITGILKPGRNAIGAWLAPGWYTTPLTWDQQPYNYGDTPPALRAQLRIEYNDGSIAWVDTGDGWKAAVSPVLKAEIYDGETYDARREQPGWSTASFDDSHWSPAQVVEPREPAIFAQDYQPIRIETTRAATNLTEPKPGVYVFDFGQNLAGFAHIRVQGKAGATVQLRFAEVLNPDGTLYTANLRTAKATDRYTLRGGSPEEWQPSFTYHGFRYVELTGLDRKPMLSDVTVKVIHTDAPFHLRFSTGSPMINRLGSNILWGQRSNFVGVPTDCPQRDERLGWAGDAEVFWRAASYNMGLGAFSRKYAGDLRGTLVGTPMYGIYAPGTSVPNAGFGAGWSDAGVIIPWTSWLQTGDTRIIQQNWDAMTSYLDAIENSNPDFLWSKNAGIPLGDWLAPEGQTAPVLIQTAYWAYDVSLMRQMAHAIGRGGEEQKYAALFQNIQKAFAAAFVRPDGFVAGAAIQPAAFGHSWTPNQLKSADTQTGYVLALHMNLVPASLRAAAANRLVEKIRSNGWKLGTGFLGTPYLLAVLTDTGHADVAYRLLLNTAYPSWGYLVEHGATTMWERWNGDRMRGDPSMNSYNHYAYGSVADWIYRYAGGIDAEAGDAGFHTIHLHPNFDARLGSLNLAYDSPYGEVRSEWTVHGSTAVWNLTIPPNAVGKLTLTAAQTQAFMLDGAPLAQSRQIRSVAATPEGSVWQIPAGAWRFSSRSIVR